MSRKKLKRRTKLAIVYILTAIIISIPLILGLRWRVHQTAAPFLRQVDSVEPSQAALIFGAYVYPNGTPCLVLQDRLQTGLSLYQSGAVSKLLLSGDHGSSDYDEVNAMKVYLEARGVPSEDIYCDHAGFDTYDSLYRARDIFGAENLILVTQTFHLKRALYIANALGIEAVGVPSDHRVIPEIKSLEFRELAANFKALWDVTVARPPALLGSKIPLTGSSALSHDAG